MFGGVNCYDFECSVRLLKAAEVDWCIKYGCENMEGPIPFALCNMSLRSCLQEHMPNAVGLPRKVNATTDLSNGNEIESGSCAYARAC